MGKKALLALLAVSVFFLQPALTVHASPGALPVPNLSIGLGAAQSPQDTALSLQIMLLLTVLTLAPAILIMMTSFTRIIIVLSFVRSALATQQMPPNQVLIGLAMFLTFFTMSPYFSEMNEKAFQPYMAGALTQEQAVGEAVKPLRTFMMKQTRENDLALFVDLSKDKRPESPDDVPIMTVIPAFIISELKTAFQIGFLIYIPFIVIDMVVASTLMSMGMMMVPPVMISLPFKILLFILVDGWHLIVKSLVASFG